MRNLGFLGFVLVLGIACKRTGGETDAPTTGDAPEEVAPTEDEGEEVEKPAEPVDPNMCVLVKDEWETCNGQLVTIDGENASMVQQHPMVAGPEEEQGYMDVAGVGQIILLTKHQVDCDGKMRVTGTLRGIDLGGEPGTKQSYGGWVVEHAHFTCQ